MFSLPAFTVFDTETTGLDPKKGDRIIEIAGVRVENGQVLEEAVFVEFVNPERALSPEARRINKISESDISDALTIDEVLPKFLDFAAGTLLVAHNAQFDMNFLENEKQCCWGYVQLPECLCTMKLSQAVFPREFRHNLDVVSQRLNLSLPPARHRALPDVFLTAQALLKMIEMGNVRSIDELRRMAAYKQMAKV